MSGKKSGMFAPRFGGGGLLSGFVDDLEAAVPRSEKNRPASVGEWASGAPIMLDRGAFSFKGREYLEAPYSDDHPYQVEMKCTQMGQTVRAILRAFFIAVYLNVVGVIYLFPSAKGSGDFSRSRVDPMIKNNPDVFRGQIQSTDSVGLKRVGNANLYFRGTKSAEGLLSDPADLIVYDEYDHFEAGTQEAARGRLAASELGWEHLLSNPTLPDFGIDREFQATDQNYWLLKCSKCGKYTCMEDTWPECLAEFSDGRVIRLCQSCRDKELDPAQGLWVPKNPSVKDARGYHYSGLFSQMPARKPSEILRQYRTTTNMQKFHNFVLGLPYAEASNRLSKEQLFALCGNQGIESGDSGPCYIGVDQKSVLHAVVIKRHPPRVVHLGVYRDWEEIDRLIRAFNASGVIDGAPEIRAPKELAAKYPGRVYVNFYSDRVKETRWDDERRQVTTGRTESLDISGAYLAKGAMGLPRRCDVVEDFVQHCHDLAKALEENEETGEKKYRYVRVGKKKDDFRHAYNYAVMMMERRAGSFFGDGDLT